MPETSLFRFSERCTKTDTFARWKILFVLILFFFSGNSILLRAEETPVPGPDSAGDATEVKDAVDQEPEDDPCRVSLEGRDSLVDRVNRGIYTTICATSRWFDTFFGDARAHDENSSTYGSISLGLKWTEYYDFEPILRARINFDLPNASRKFRLFLGRVDTEQFVQDTETLEDGGLPITMEPEQERWVFGLGYTPLRGRSQRISIHVGLEASLPIDPYVKVQYRWLKELSRTSLFRFRQTLFWQREKGAGTTTNLDLEFRPTLSTLFRLSGRGTIYEKSEGVEWRTSLVGFRRLAKSRAVGFRLWVKGKEKAPVPLTEYGVWTFFRRRLNRKWLYGDIGTGVSWPRKFLREKRQASWGLSLGVQIQFGDIITGLRRNEDSDLLTSSGP